MRKAPRSLTHLALIALAAAALFPVYFILDNSLKDTVSFAVNPWNLPSAPVWSNWSEAWGAVSGAVLNSLVLVGVSVLGVLALASLAAYAFSVLRWPGRDLVFLLVFALMLIPDFLTLIPLYLQITRLNLANGYAGLILTYLGNRQPFSIFVLKTADERISKELLDAARIDGAGNFRIYWSLVLPLTVPVLISVGIVDLISIWNDYLLPKLLLDQAHQTVTMALVNLQGENAYGFSVGAGPLLAGYAIVSLPLLIIFGFLMRHYIQGLTGGALKL